MKEDLYAKIKAKERRSSSSSRRWWVSIGQASWVQGRGEGHVWVYSGGSAAAVDVQGQEEVKEQRAVDVQGQESLLGYEEASVGRRAGNRALKKGDFSSFRGRINESPEETTE